MEKTFWFDMDGTIANLYGVANWLDKLIAEDESPYLEARPMCNMSLLARYLNKVQKLGFKIGIISWLSKSSTTSYDEKVVAAKKKWLNKHLTSVSWDSINIVPYGTPKISFKNSNDDILFDDEVGNRKTWGDTAYTPDNIMEMLKANIA